MKKVLLIASCLLVLLLVAGCGAKTYEFENSIDEIERIEIVSAENSREFTVTKTLSETEKNDFLEQFQAMKFDRYYLGDPLSVNGEAVKITYRDGNYEMICHYWADYVKDGEIYSVWKSCDEEEFNQLLDRFLE
jgi:hypothetical protein